MRLLSLMLLCVCLPIMLFAVVVQFDWERTTEAYHVIIGTNEMVVPPLVDDIVSNTNYITVLNYGNYYMRIAPVFRGVEGRYSKTLPFAVSDTPLKLDFTNQMIAISIFDTKEVSYSPVSNALKWNWVIQNNGPLSGALKMQYSIDRIGSFSETADNPFDLFVGGLKEGSHTLFYRFIDPLGREGKILTRDFVIDRTPPEIKIIASRNRRIGEKNFVSPGSRIQVNVEDALSKFEYLIGINGQYPNDGSYLVDRRTNEIEVAVFARDSFGNERYAVNRFDVDTTPPVIQAFVNGSLITNAAVASTRDRIDFMITDNSEVAGQQYLLDKTSGHGPFLQLYGLKEGTHTLTLQAWDIFGNTNSAEYQLKLLPTAPDSIYIIKK